MSQSRFSIVLVGVSALLRRPLVSRLRPADGERSSWVVFTARGCRFESGFRSVVGLRVHRFRFSACTDSELPSAGWPSGSQLPLFVAHRFGDSARRIGASAFRFGDSAQRVGLRVHCFRFSARAASEWPLGEFVLPPSASELPFGGLAFGLTASAFRHAPLRGCPRRVGSSARRVGLRAHCFRFSACTASEWPLGELVLPLVGLVFPPSASEIALGGLAFGLTASAFRHAPLRRLPSAGWPSGSPLPLFGTHRFGDCPRRVGLRAHCFRFSACTASEWPLGEFVLLPSASEIALGGLIIPLGGLAFGLTASAFRHAPLRRFRSAGWPSGSLLPLFGTRRSAPLHR